MSDKLDDLHDLLLLNVAENERYEEAKALKLVKAISTLNFAPQAEEPASVITKDIETVHIVLKRVNGHFEPMAPVIESFPTPEAASTHRSLLAKRHQGQTFAVFALVQQETYQPIAVVETVKAGGEC
jgi:hypothetical protein